MRFAATDRADGMAPERWRPAETRQNFPAREKIRRKAILLPDARRGGVARRCFLPQRS
jgi:hypothetical protein